MTTQSNTTGKRQISSMMISCRRAVGERNSGRVMADLAGVGGCGWRMGQEQPRGRLDDLSAILDQRL